MRRSMKRYAPYLFCAAGLLVLFLLMPYFNAAQPRGIRITEGQARAIADAAAQKQVGIPIDRAWSVRSSQESARLRTQLDPDLELLRKAAGDPVVGPRLGFYHFMYYTR